MSLSTLVQEISSSNCTNCKISEQRKKIVVYRGNFNAKIAFVGEAPGKVEEERGIPFCGPAGLQLDKDCLSIGLNTNLHMFMTNAVVCRPYPPPGSRKQNRTPVIDEVRACRENLVSLIEELNPAVIVAAGATALKATMTNPPRAITPVAGQFFSPEEHIFDVDADLYVMYHPSYRIRDGVNLNLWMGHLLRLRDYAIGRGIIC